MDAYNDWSIISESLIPRPWLLGLMIVLLGALGFAWRGYRGHARAWLLWSLRAMACAVVAFMLWQPALRLRKVSVVPSDIAVIVDDSASMLLSDETTTRHQHTQMAVQHFQSDIAQASDRYRIKLRNLHDDLPPTQAVLQEPHAQDSPILTRIEDTITAWPQLAGVVVISDGADTNAISPVGIQRIVDSRIPINVLPIGSLTFRDDAIESITAGDFAFVQNTFPMRVNIRSTGFQSGVINVALRQGNTPIANTQITLDDQGMGVAEFNIKTEHLGEWVYTAEINLRDGDAIPSNNQKHHTLRVLRDKIRVLQVAGRPSWDERFVRQYFQEDPNVDLISFFILRTSSDNTGPQEDLSLIPFPVDELFTTKLSSFDVILFQNFDFRPYRMEQYLGNIQRAVENGVGFVMMGGDQSFVDGGYAQTPIARILPITLNPNGHYTSQTIQPLLGPGGKHHPMGLQHGMIPPWQGYNALGEPKPGASVILQSSTGMPLMVAGDAQKGRVIAIGTDSLWRWRFRRPADQAEHNYQRFWHHTLRWLVRDPSHAHLRIHLPQSTVPPHVPVLVRIALNDASYQPKANSQVIVQVLRNNQEIVQEQTHLTDNQGEIQTALKDLPEGVYSIRAQQPGDAETADAALVVSALQPEHQSAAPRHAWMHELAQQTHGASLTRETASLDHLKLRDPKIVDVEKQTLVPLWDTWPTLVLFLFLLSMEWSLRKRWGYS